MNKNEIYQARPKGGRSSGGSRYYNGKTRGEDKLLKLLSKIQKPSRTEIIIDQLKIETQKTKEKLAILKEMLNV